jgi:hypothetical protein
MKLSKQILEDQKVPSLLVQCVEYLRLHGLDQDGLFRVSIDSVLYKRVEEIIRSDTEYKGSFIVIGSGYQSTTDVDVDALVVSDVHEVAAVFKILLHEMKEPIVPNRILEDVKAVTLSLEQTIIGHSEWTDRMNEFISSMPSKNKEILTYILDFLVEVSTHEGLNKMSIGNLSNLLGPAILHPSNDEVVENMLLQRALENMLANAKKSKAESLCDPIRDGSGRSGFYAVALTHIVVFIIAVWNLISKSNASLAMREDINVQLERIACSRYISSASLACVRLMMGVVIWSSCLYILVSVSNTQPS